MDLANAFLQTQPTEADSRIWTTVVKELREGLGAQDGEVLRVLKNVYGSTTTARGLWLHLHRTLTELGGHAVLGERCLWIFPSKADNGPTRHRCHGWTCR